MTIQYSFIPGHPFMCHLECDLCLVLVKNLNFIELFAGCGGLSLGLKSMGLRLVIANELSPMAAETYAYNFFDEDLSSQSTQSKSQRQTLWISSAYPPSEFSKRLRENPFNFPKIEEGFSDLPNDGDLDGKLLIGNICELNKWIQQNPTALKKIRSSFGRGEIDLISGGPPCQSFSMAGLREKDSDKNSLPWEFATFAELVKPKLILLENVSGILRPFKSDDGKRYFAWFEIAKAFVQIGYIPLCLHVNAKFVGVPQNRPRFVLLGIRIDLHERMQKNFNSSEQTLLNRSIEFFYKERSNTRVDLSDLQCWDLSTTKNKGFIKETFLNPLISQEQTISVKESIDDLRSNSKFDSKFKLHLTSTFKKTIKHKPIANHEFRKNSPLVMRRFRIYQILNKVSPNSKKEIVAVIKSISSNVSKETWQDVRNFSFQISPTVDKKFISKSEFVNFISKHKTKKRTQKALVADQPAPAALSIPDDACHYHSSELRTLSVREMARIQSFPDHFEFRSKITTGGKMRRFEVPQYTQVGNAVPPLLGRALGQVALNLLKKITPNT
jgi:DNA (cytosine-5)-methyltransferase 1